MTTSAKTRIWIGLLGTLAICVIIPLLAADQRFLAFIIGITFIQLLMAAGMNLLYGYTGLMPLMYAGISGIGAYGSVSLVKYAGWSFWSAMPVAALGAALAGVLLGLPSLRLKGFYFTLSSLVIQTVLTLAFISFPSLTSGDLGISQIPAPDLPFSHGGQIKGLWLDLLIAAIAWGGVVGIWAITRSGFGAKLVAVREDAELAETLGINVVRCKLLAFFIGSLYAAVGGSLTAAYVGFISPRSFDVLSSLNIWLLVAFGGRGTILGPIIGTIILAPLPSFLLKYYMVKDILYGSLIIAVIVLMPAGIYGEVRKRIEARAKAGRSVPALLSWVGK